MWIKSIFKKSQEPEDLLKALWERYEILRTNIPLIWQLDGRPMSGDLAPTTSRDTVKLFEKIGSDLPPGLIQLQEEQMKKLMNF